MSFAACVIGAGPAGLAATTALRRVGAMVTCFEIQPALGGIWNANVEDIVGSRGINSPMHAAMRTVLPKDLMAFSDKRFNFSVPVFPHHTAVKQYLHEYAVEKGIGGLIRYNTVVQRVRRDAANHCWSVTTVNFKTGDVFDWRFDAVVVASGRTSEPRFPEEKVEGEFDYTAAGGVTRHVSEVKQFRDFKNKRVIVVGDGVAAYEHCQLLMEADAQVFHSSLVAPSARDPSALEKTTKQKWRHNGLAAVLANLPLDGANQGQHKERELLCRWLRRSQIQRFRCPRIGRILSVDGAKNVVAEVDPVFFAQEENRRLLLGRLKKQQRDLERWATEYPEVAANEAIEAARVDDGTTVEVEGIDEIIYATGYNLRFPFLPDDVRSVVEAKPMLRIMAAESEGYKDQTAEEQQLIRQLKEDLRNGVAVHHRGLFMGCVYASDPSLAFIGLPNDLLPPFMIFEAQAKYIAAVLSQRIAIPATEEEMRAEEREFASIYTARGAGLDSIAYYNALQAQTTPVDPPTFVDEVGKRRWWFVGTWMLMFVQRIRALAPLKRRQQHVIISNKV